METRRMQSYRLGEDTIEAIADLAAELGCSKADAIARAVGALDATRRCAARMPGMATGADAAGLLADALRPYLGARGAQSSVEAMAEIVRDAGIMD